MADIVTEQDNPEGTPSAALEPSQEPAPGTSEYYDKMTKVAQQQSGEQGDTDPTEHQTPSDPVEELTGKPEPPKTDRPDETDLNTVTTREAAAQYLSQHGVELNKLEAEFAQSGSLSKESYEQLAKAGFPRFYVDNYIRGQQASINQLRSEVLGVVGGEEAYGEVVAWAGKALSPSEALAYNSVVEGADIEAIKLAVRGLHSRYLADTKEKPLLMGGTGNDNMGEFASRAEMAKAMSDPRYETDPAYRAMVANKVMRSQNML